MSQYKIYTYSDGHTVVIDENAYRDAMKSMQKVWDNPAHMPSRNDFVVWKGRVEDVPAEYKQ